MKKDLNKVIIRPHITEKATISSEKSVYVFEVDSKSTKASITRSFEEKYKISPVKVSTVTIPAKSVFVRGKKGSKSGYKKAYVYLKPGTKIENL
ncbi:MAG TPA: 50S ribosomal protein L23 [Parcubacteria group bacterium]|jgi:large subunit ribosomal protein L23|nr:50S ribosomal protein L23 [Parcubacteria group bacterium]